MKAEETIKFSSLATGSCNCGRVAFEITCEITDIYICHCSICRKSTGTNGVAVVVIDNENFRWSKGQDQICHWQKPGHDWDKNFCRRCGSPLPGSNDPKRVFVPVGLLDSGDKNLKVAHHIWMDSKANWDEPGDQGVRHAKGLTQSSV